MGEDESSSRRALLNFVQELNQTCLEIQESTSQAIKEQKRWNETATKEFNELMERMKNPVSKVKNARRTRSSVQDVKVDEDEPVNEPIDDSLLHASNSDIAIKSFNSSGFCLAFMTLHF
ncbi:hypothetical protein GUITHDRAFT_151512 [Guillardia theta CCMP2712]|uniref:Uncharacterized protein n=1 Tax=Guillardia theta (strain CCMP2712) TaxID=905079 RepID=L1JLU9_GUITC|nr:hypothetical protein GUITHDRAFT_151512 [Guillardia theta CCMP2712]EKX49337.1 hypothetical protein GUITHDRAFT_151512 [Guillardia theta CCMP2712]|eukprot:XP_005836317.1 hypothetical protein GUITHDRAFT_151512 [Guillardia theta CCMP2712]